VGEPTQGLIRVLHHALRLLVRAFTISKRESGLLVDAQSRDYPAVQRVLG
jgi:hypothetical protein